MNATYLLSEAYRAFTDRGYFTLLDVLEQSATILKLRLYITATLFLQIYRNDRLDTTNLVLVYNGQRLYARDQLDSRWHRHPADNPVHHDFTPEGQRAVDLDEFLDEVEVVVANMGLP